MKLNKTQKLKYISWFENDEDIERLKEKLNKIWSLRKVKNRDDNLHELYIDNIYTDDIYNFGVIELTGH